jgi:hypothetical protein
VHFAVKYVNTRERKPRPTRRDGGGKPSTLGTCLPPSSLGCQKRLANVFPTPPTAHGPKLQTKCRSSDGDCPRASVPEASDPPIKIGANTPQCRARPVPETRTCICAPPAGRIDARCNAGQLNVWGDRKSALADAKAARGRTKKVGRGGTVTLEPGKENCHVNNDRQDSRHPEGWDFPPSLPAPNFAVSQVTSRNNPNENLKMHLP